MREQFIKTSIGEVCDRYSICLLKEERTDLDCREEISALMTVINSYKDITKYIDKLLTINGNIWNLESDIRKGKENILGLKEVGSRALQIRDLNKKRVECKNNINELFKEGFTEVKHDHASL